MLAEAHAMRARTPRSAQLDRARGQSLTLRVVLAGYDARFFGFAVIVAARMDVDELRAAVPSAPSFARALARVRAECAHRADDEVVTDPGMPASIVCPISAKRIASPARYAECKGMAVFDLDTHLRTAHHTRRWKCPQCPAAGPASKLERDPFMAGVVAAISASASPTDAQVDTVQLLPCGGWRAKFPGRAGWGRVVPPGETEAALSGVYSGAAFTDAGASSEEN